MSIDSNEITVPDEYEVTIEEKTLTLKKKNEWILINVGKEFSKEIPSPCPVHSLFPAIP